MILILSYRLTLLYNLNNKFGIPSVWKPLPPDIATQAVLEKIADDPLQGCGVGTIGVLLSNEGTPLPRSVHPWLVLAILNYATHIRDFIRNVLATHTPEGLAHRFPGANQIHLSTLSSIRPNHQHHADGHEKLNAQALNMGGVGLNIYSIKDQWSSFILYLVVVLNNRLATTIGHVYLDCIEKYKCKQSIILIYGHTNVSLTVIPITLVTDKGSETGFIYASQSGLQ